MNTQIPVCLWFLTNDKSANGRDRSNETLFIDARNLGTMETRVLKVLTDEDIQKVQDTVSSWRTGEGYEDIEGYCKSSTTEEIEKNGFVLTSGRYVGFADEDDGGVAFEEKMELLTNKLTELTESSSDLSKAIKGNLAKIGYEN